MRSEKPSERPLPNRQVYRRRKRAVQTPMGEREFSCAVFRNPEVGKSHVVLITHERDWKIDV